MSDRGSATIVMVSVTALLGVLLVATTTLGGLFAVRAQASSAADAAALAAAVATYPGVGRASPAVEARRVAVDNGAVLVECLCRVDESVEPREVTVIVSIEMEAPLFGSLQIRHASRAEFDPMEWLGR